MDVIQGIIVEFKSDGILYYLPFQENFDIIVEARIAIKYGGCDRFRTDRKYANITIKRMNLFPEKFAVR